MEKPNALKFNQVQVIYDKFLQTVFYPEVSLMTSMHQCGVCQVLYMHTHFPSHKPPQHQRKDINQEHTKRY